MSNLQGNVDFDLKIVGTVSNPRSGDSAYQVAVNNGFVGSEKDWLASLKGEKGKAGSIKFIAVNDLPTENIDESAIYMKPSDDSEEENTYEEYIYINGVWERLGSGKVEVNLDDYATKDYVSENNKEVYSTSEKRIGKWIDEKPIYRRVFTFQTQGNKANYSPVIPNIDKVISFDGFTTQPGGDVTSVNYYISNNDRCSCYFSNSAKHFSIGPGVEYGFGTVNLVVEYTKTTD